MGDPGGFFASQTQAALPCASDQRHFSYNAHAVLPEDLSACGGGILNHTVERTVCGLR